MDQNDFTLVSIRNVSLSNLGFIIFLEREDDERVLPIFIGAAEAHSIAAVLNQQDFPRPLSHDLFKEIFSYLGAEISKIYITELTGGTFYARVFLRHNNMEIDVDSRPSDAIALALRYNAPVYASNNVFDEASVNVSQNAEDQGEDPVKKLKEDMDTAVTEERYEDAATIRDKLKKLQTGN